MVMAWGDNGMEPTPASEVVMIEVLPLAEGNRSIPATLRSLRFQPVRLVGIRRAGYEWPLVRMAAADGYQLSCFVRNEQDAADPVFSGLPAHSRARIAASAPR
jgi:hypothetical protein